MKVSPLVILLLPALASSSHNDKASLVDDASSSNRSLQTCVDQPGWTDLQGYTCDWYGLYGAHQCWIDGDTFPGYFGMTATQACCICQVGFYPTPNWPAYDPNYQCSDFRGWTDVDGYDCSWYALGDRCTEYGDLFEKFGLVANQACCACGGGRDNAPTPAPFPTPTVPFPTLPDPTPTLPQPGPTPFCVNNPLNWVDAQGWDCSWYSVFQCEADGFLYAGTNQLTANQACCTCGGGLRSPGAPTTPAPVVPGQPTPRPVFVPGQPTPRPVVPGQPTLSPVVPPASDQFDFHIDCNIDGVEFTKTIATIEVKFLDVNNNVIGANYFQGLDCPLEGEFVSIFSTVPVTGVRLATGGWDATLVDRAWLSQGGNEINDWGFTNGVGWCLSRDNGRPKDNDWEDLVEDFDGKNKCVRCVRLQNTGFAECEDTEDTET